MAQGSNYLTTYYAKRIIGDAAAANSGNGLLQSGAIASDMWIFSQNNRASAYGIKYVYDSTEGKDKVEFYGGESTATAWVQLDTGDAVFNTVTADLEGIAHYARLLYPQSSNTVCDESSWSVIPAGGVKVWGESFSNPTLKYINDGVESTITDSGHIIMWLQPDNGTSNFAMLCMRIDGTFQSSKFIGPLNGNADSATTWEHTRTLTIGETGKGVNGSENVSWSKDEILGTSDSTQFYRGDNVWSNTLTNTLILDNGSANGELLRLVGVNDKAFSFKLTSPAGQTAATNVDIGWDWAAGDGAGAAFRNALFPNQPGYFVIYARANTTAQYALVGKTDGTLTWTGKIVPNTGNTSGTVGGTTDPVWVNAGVITAITAGTTAQFYRGDKTWSNTLVGAFTCNSTLTVNAENSTTEGGQICLKADPNHSAYHAYLDVCNNYFRVHSNGEERISVELASNGVTNIHGKLIVNQPATHRDNGVYGSYDYTKAATIWSMGTAYKIAADGSSLGSLYGAAYGYKEQAYLGNNTYAGGHQFLWCENGAVKVALGQNIWTNGSLYINGANHGIYYEGSKATYRMIRFLDNTSDTYGNGISIGGGGLTILGSGESADTIVTNVASAGGTETTYIAADGSIEFYPGQNSYDAAARIWMTAGVLNIGTDGNTTRENSINIYSGAGRVQLYSAAATNGNRGLWFGAHGSGGSKSVITVNTNNSVTVSSNAITTDYITAYNSAGFISSIAGSPWPYIRFDTRAGGSTYVTTAQTNWCELYAQVPAKRDTTYYKTRFFFRQYSKTANTTTRLNYYEDYYLPETNDGRTGNGGYNILTTKDMSFSITGSSGSCTGNAATATRINGNLGAISSATNCNIWVSSDASASGIPKYVSGVYVTANTGVITAKGFVGPLTGNVTGNCSGSSGSCTGNAATATKLQTARSLWGNSFNGSADISGHIKLAASKHLYMTYNSTEYSVLHNHNNGNVSIEACSGGLYIGYSNTTLIDFMSGKMQFKDGCLSIFPTSSSYREGIRIHSVSSWSDITLCGNDNTGDSGISANSWFIGNNNGNFYIARNGSPGSTAYLSCVSNAWTFLNKVRIASTEDVGKNKNGALIIGNPDGVNIGIDTDEIMARNNGATSTLYLNYDGGTIDTGGNILMHGTGDGYIEIKRTDTSCRVELDNSSGNHGLWSSGYWNGSAYTGSACWFLYRGTDSYVHSGTRIYNAVWNDFAEYREGITTEGGRVVYDDGTGVMKLTTERLQPAARIISDTFGMAVGESDKAKTPIGVGGRVLAYPYRSRRYFKVGDAVCAAPNGTIDVMTREEIVQYPERIIGVVSEIPTYKIWRNSFKDEEFGLAEVEVKNRIWIYVR